MRTTASNSLTIWCCLAVAWILVVAGDYAVADATTQPAIQTKCPVMDDQDINPQIYSEYKGKRVYFCCLSCKAKFDADPEKYLSNLPQFAAGLSEGQPIKPARPKFWGRRWIEPMGATTLILLITTVCLALLRRIRWPKPGFILRLHKIAGICTLCAGLIHAALLMLR